MESIGRKRWAIAEGYIPATSHGSSPQMTSHETVCLLNTSDRDARVRITVFYTDREPVGPYQLTVAGWRTRHTRFNAQNASPFSKVLTALLLAIREAQEDTIVRTALELPVIR